MSDTTRARQLETTVFASPWLWTAVGAVVVGAAVGVALAVSGKPSRDPTDSGTSGILIPAP